jgi:hypothetical protein
MNPKEMYPWTGGKIPSGRIPLSEWVADTLVQVIQEPQISRKG